MVPDKKSCKNTSEMKCHKLRFVEAGTEMKRKLGFHGRIVKRGNLSLESRDVSA